MSAGDQFFLIRINTFPGSLLGHRIFFGTELLGIHQSRVSDLVRGKIDRFSIDMLVKLLAKTGRQRSASNPTKS